MCQEIVEREVISQVPGVFGTRTEKKLLCRCGNTYREISNPGVFGVVTELKLLSKGKPKEPDWKSLYHELNVKHERLKSSCREFLDGTLDPKVFVERVMENENGN